MRGYRFSPRVLYLLGAVLVVISLFVYMKHSSFVAAAAHADGEVIKLEKRSAGHRSKGSYYPVVRFKDERGVERTFTGSVGSQPSAWNVGEAVDVGAEHEHVTPRRLPRLAPGGTSPASPRRASPAPEPCPSRTPPGAKPWPRTRSR